MKIQRKIVSLLLAICLAGVLLPATVSAVGDTGKAVQLGTGGIKSPTATTTSDGTYQVPNSYVYFGMNGSDPIKWRVLDADKANDGITSGMFLLSEYLLGTTTFGSTNTYQSSDAQTWCINFASNSSIFSTAEQDAMLGVTKTESAEYSLYSLKWGTSSLTTDDKMFFLSVRELANYVGDYRGALGLSTTDANGSAGMWWLRSPNTNTSRGVGVVSQEGAVRSGNTSANTPFSVRPAFNLNLDSVLFTSAASGGKSASGMDSGLTAVSAYTGSDWKLTLLDSSRDSFTAEFVKTSTSTYIAYSNAQTGSNEYISALVTDSSGDVTYYGRLKNLTDSSNASGTIEIDLSGITMADNDTLYIFNEQYNGDYMTDYASALTAVTVPTTVNAYDITNSLTNIFTSNTDNYCLISSTENYTATLTATNGYVLPDSITVTVGGTALGTNAYTYNSATGELTVPDVSITGDIVIAAAGVACTYTLSVTAPTFDAVTYGYTQPDAKSITITGIGNSSATITSVTLDEDSYFTITGSGDTVTAGGSVTTYTIRPTANLAAGTYTAAITVTYNNGATATANVSFIVNKAAQSISYSETSLTKHINDGAFINELLKDAGDGAISYASDNTDVATVDGNGAVTIAGTGTATITATAASSDNYNEATAAYSLTVTDHSWDGGTVTKAAACTEVGAMTYTCTACGETKTETIAATGHSLTHIEAKEATCTDDGNSEYWYCADCGKYFSNASATREISLSDTMISPTGHVDGDAKRENEVAATATEDGSYDRAIYCSECGAELFRETITIPATGSGGTAAEASDAPQTGDDAQIAMWAGFVILSAGIVIILLARKRVTK